MHHAPPDTRVFSLLMGVTREVLYLGAHLHRGIGASYLLDVDHRRHPLDQCAIPLLGFPQLAFRLPALGDVLDLGDEVEWIALRTSDKRNTQQGPHCVAVSVEEALIQVVLGDLAFYDSASISQTGCQIVGVGDLLPR